MLKACTLLLLFCTSLIFFPWLEGTAILKGINQVHIKDWFIGEPIPLVHGSLDACTSHCGIMDESMSLFYNGAAQRCICSNYGYIKRPLALGHSSAGWNYYLILDERCPRENGYVYSKIFHSCYKLHEANSSLSYDDYSPICENEGGELMKIDSEKKQQHIADFLNQFEITTWILFQGYHRTADLDWYYNDGSIMSYFNWHPTQPDMTLHGVEETIGMKKYDGYKWHDIWLYLKEHSCVKEESWNTDDFCIRTGLYVDKFHCVVIFLHYMLFGCVNVEYNINIFLSIDIHVPRKNYLDS